MRVLIDNRPATAADYQAFRRAKQVKREPIRLRLRGVAKASFRPRSRAAFLGMRERLRQSAHFGPASERIDAIEYELRLRGAALPVPTELMQNEDSSISLFFGSLSIRVRGDQVVWLIGGTAGAPGIGIRRELLDALQLVGR